jgi:hypothetical protein
MKAGISVVNYSQSNPKPKAATKVYFTSNNETACLVIQQDVSEQMSGFFMYLSSVDYVTNKQHELLKGSGGQVTFKK